MDTATISTAVSDHQMITIRGKQVRLGRLTSSVEAEVFFTYLAPAIAPLTGDVLDKLAPLFGVGTFAPGKQLGLAVSMEKLVQAMEWGKVKALAQRVLECTTYNGKSIWPQMDAVCVTALDWITLVVAAIRFLYADFFEALGSLPFLARAKEAASASGGSTASSGPSGV